MDISSATVGENQVATLLLETSETILEIAEVARSKEANEERKVFYSHLRFHCARFRDHVMYAKQASFRLDSEHINRILSHFESLVAECSLQESLSPPVSTSIRLRTLNLHWSEIRNQNDDLRLEFIGRWLKFGSSDKLRDELDKSLENCGDELIARQPRGSSKWSVDTFAPMEISEPSHAVWKAAQSIFDALLDCEKCTCPDQHEFGAKLSLGTYRKPTRKRIRNPYRNPTRKARGDNDAGGELDFDMFLSMEQDWQEVRIKTAKERVVRWAMAGEVGQPQEHNKTYESTKVEKLCKHIAEIKKKALQRLVLKLTSGHLFELGFERSNFQIDKNTEPISLSRCFEERYQFFTEKVKRILSLVLSYAVLHLYGTSWLQPGWGSSNIKFFRTASSKTPLRPFIQTQLPKAGLANTNPGPQLSVHGVEGRCSSDELDLEHRCPALVALAVILMEVYFVTPFETLAKNYGVELIKEPTGRITLADALLVFYGDEEEKIEGCRSQIPEDCPVLTAIENCLDGEIWEDESGNALDGQTIRSRIYQEIVRPLEAHLSHGFSQIPLDSLDKYAQDLDFGNWCQIAPSQESRDYDSLWHASEHSQARSLSPGLMWQFSLSAGSQPPFQHLESPLSEHMHWFKDQAAAERLTPSHDRPYRREDFQIAIVCALVLEYDAVSLLFDQFWDEDDEPYGRARGDTNTYTTGRIGKHNVVLALLPNIGKVAAAGVAASVRSSYSGLRLAFLVGICGGVPDAGTDEALLGDVVISKTVIQHDLGRQHPNTFVTKDMVDDNLGRPNRDIRSLIASFETELGRRRLRQKAGQCLKDLQSAAVRERHRCSYQYPGTAEDKLFAATYRHKHRWPQSCSVCDGEADSFCEDAARASCAELNCDEGHLLPRKRLEAKRNLKPDDMQCPEILIGRMASGDTVMKSGEHRDQIAKQHNVIAFEMEGAGAWDEVPCIIIKGICDYADSHKNKMWQPFAAAAAASVMKAVLGRYTLTDSLWSAVRSIGECVSPSSGPEFALRSDGRRNGGHRTISNNKFGNHTQIS